MAAKTMDERRREPVVAPQLVSVEDAAVALGIGRSPAWELVRTGKLRTVRIGTRRLVPVDAIDELVAELADGSGTHK